MSDDDVIMAHEHCKRNRSELRASDRCACFYCLEVFTPPEIQEWVDGGGTALCPFCGIDAVLSSKCGYSLTREFLKQMKAHWF